MVLLPATIHSKLSFQLLRIPGIISMVGRRSWIPLIPFIFSACRGQNKCETPGYFPDMEGSCSNFYRCTDIWGNGVLQMFHFTCGPGTMFDPKLSVCNWPEAVVECGFECKVAGIFGHKTQCNKFWLCKPDKNSKDLKVSVEALICFWWKIT